MGKNRKAGVLKKSTSAKVEEPTRVAKFKSWAENHPWISVLIVIGIVVTAIGTLTDAADKVLKLFRSSGPPVSVGVAPTNKHQVGQDSVVIGRVEGPVGDRSVAIGATDSNGNTVLNQPMAVGFNAQAGPGSIAIGANARAGTFISAYPTNEMEAVKRDARDAKENSAETLATVRRMEAAKREKDADPIFKALFPFGYILFTATGRKEIIPMNPSPMDEIEFRWREGYSVEMTTEDAAIHLPPFTVHGNANFSIGKIRLPRTVGSATSPMRFGTNLLTFLVVSTNANETMVAAGLQPVGSLERLQSGMEAERLGLVSVGTSKDACSKDNSVRVTGKTGRVTIPIESSRLIELTERTSRIDWIRDSARENSTNNQSFDYVICERAGNGALSWTFYRRP